MKLNEINKELQTWFKIESYEDVENLSLRDFHKEFQVRKNIFEGMDFFDGDDQIFKRILDGEPLVSSIFDMKDLTNHSNSHIQQVTFKQIDNLKRALEIFSPDSFINGTNELKKEIKSQPLTVSMRDVIKRNDESRVFISFDIETSSDEEVLNSLNVMLPVWRNEYQIKESKLEKFGLAKIIKLIDYRILPMMDLLLWAKFKKISLTNTVLSRIVYPRLTDEIRGEEQLKETDRPLAEKALTGETCKSIENFINKNIHMDNITLSELRILL